MPRLSKKRVLYVGTPPFSQDDAVLTWNARVKPIDGPTAKKRRNSFRFGQNVHYHTAPFNRFTFSVELARNVSGLVEPAWFRLLRLCAFNTFTNTVPSPDQATALLRPGGDVTEDLTIAINIDGVEYAATGIVGNVTLSLSANSLPLLNFELIGNYVEPSDVAIPTDSDWSAYRAPQPINCNHTTATVHGESVILYSFDLNVGNKLEHKCSPGRSVAYIADRESTFSIVIEESLTTEKNWYADILERDNSAIVIEHDDVFVSLSSAQLHTSDLEDRSGITALSMRGLAIDSVSIYMPLQSDLSLSYDGSNIYNGSIIYQ